MSLDVREVESQDAPLALEWELGRTRWFEGSHYLFGDNLFDPGQHDDEKAAALLRYLNGEGAREHTDINAYLDTARMTSDRKFTVTKHPEFEDDDQRLLALRKAEAFGSDTILVDGGLWLRCGEPRLVYFPASRLLPAHVLILTTEFTTDRDRYGKDIRPPSLFVAANSASVDSVDQIDQIASSYAIQPSMPSFTLHMPETVLRDDYASMIMEAAEALLMDWKQEKLPLVWRSRAADDLTYLDCLMKEAGSSLDEVAQTMSRILGAYSLQVDPRDHIARVIQRWEDRPIGIDLTLAVRNGPTP